MAVLCRKYGISRRVGYKWRARYESDGFDGLKDLSRAPKNHPNRVTAEVIAEVLSARAAHPTWGPKKLRVLLVRHQPHRIWPACSTIGEILHDGGLVVPRKRRRRVPPQQQPFANCDGPNSVWCVDFKGHFFTGQGQRCDPLTISDAFSRFLLRCQAVEKASGPGVQPIFEAAFREFGLPFAIRSDNGTPFASRAPGGLSRLSVWWLKLGIVPERIEPGKPQQNGRHERMHLTLKQETASPPAEHLRAQQKTFDRFRNEYNDVRPHEALGMQTPASLYQPSLREYPLTIPEPVYQPDWQTRRVQKRGEFYWASQAVFLTEAMAGETAGLEPIDGRHWRAYFSQVPLGIFDSHATRMLTKAERKRTGLEIGVPQSKLPSAALQEVSTAAVPEVLPMCPD